MFHWKVLKGRIGVSPRAIPAGQYLVVRVADQGLKRGCRPRRQTLLAFPPLPRATHGTSLLAGGLPRLPLPSRRFFYPRGTLSTERQRIGGALGCLLTQQLDVRLALGSAQVQVVEPFRS